MRVRDRFTDEQRLAFGRVADLYEHARPGYPDTVIEQLIDLACLRRGATVLEAGAGTGKATRALAAHGLAVHALEPDPAMAALARRTCAPYPLVQIEQVSFESWRPRSPVDAVVSAQAWHWIAPSVRCLRAAQALASGGTLAAIWTFPDWSATALGDRLRAAYADALPGLRPDFPMHPASEPADLAGDWHAEIRSCAGLSGADVRLHAWSFSCTTTGYVELLQTHQDHILLDPAQREQLLAAVSSVIDEAGGRIRLEFVTRLCLARRC